jgi:hypothetical protein
MREILAIPIDGSGTLFAAATCSQVDYEEWLMAVPPDIDGATLLDNQLQHYASRFGEDATLAICKRLNDSILRARFTDATGPTCVSKARL